MKGKMFSALLLLGLFAKGQEENTKKLISNNSSYSLLAAGLEVSTTPYINTDTKDSNAVHVYLAPYIDYAHKSGLGIRLMTYALPGAVNPGCYLTAVSPYFARYDGRLLPFISYTRYEQNSNPSIPYSPIQNEVYAHLRLKTKLADPMLGIDVGFGNDERNNNESVSDINAFFALTHTYLLQNKSSSKINMLAIRPRLQLNAGTDRYFKFLRTTGYISQNTKINSMGYGKGRGAGNNSGNNAATETAVYTISEENDFNVSNAEANLYLMYFFGRFSLEPSGSVYLPLRGSDKKLYGYWQVSLNFWIR